MSPPAGAEPLAAAVRSLTTDARWAPHFEVWREFEATGPRYGDWPEHISPRVREAAAKLGIERPYTHQAEAIDAALGGENVLVATGTASGKSLCFVAPILHAADHHRAATALLLFPTKALGHDQLDALRRWDVVLGGATARAATYDGDTSPPHRARVRDGAHVVLTNPDMLHTAILPHHTQWERFFRGLRYVVVDETHVYRGVFGSHVANVLRRLRRIARFYGASPRFLLTSATIANPAEIGAHMAGAAVRVVTDDGAPRGRKTIAFYNPPVIDRALNLRRSAILEAEALARHFLAAGVQTIVFAQSRQSAELIVRYVNDAASRTRSTSPPVRGYRGGYLPGDRREIESALREGSLHGVVATNALELGVDIGALEACVMVGYPGTIASTWQQAGRAGRRGRPAIAVLVAGGGPLDQFIVRHPDYFFGRTPEHARIDPDNLLILVDHVRCAAFELPFGQAELGAPFGAPPPPGPGGRGPAEPTAGATDGLATVAPFPPAREPPRLEDLLGVLGSLGSVRETGGTWYWLADAYPAATVSLRSAGAEPVEVILSQHGAAGAASSSPDEGPPPEVLGTVERDTAPVTVHEGAVYLHDGAAYVVESLDWDRGRATVARADGLEYTRASSMTRLRPLDVTGSRETGSVSRFHGTLEVRTRATGYRRLRFRTHETLGWGPIDLPEIEHVAGGYWFVLEDEAVERLAAIGRWRDFTGDRGPDWERQRDLARARDGNACASCGAPERPGRSHDVHHVRPFHTFGWMRGENEAYREANALDNLMTLCPSCHRAAERTLGLQGGLGGIGHALAHVAPLFLMCDARDLGVHAESRAPWTGKPTVAVYERAAAGVGFGEQLFGLHDELLRACAELIADCPCRAGCPSCVGPPGERPAEAKEHALAVLEVMAASPPDRPGHVL